MTHTQCTRPDNNSSRITGLTAGKKKHRPFIDAELVQQSVNILDVISRHVTLKRSGQQYTGLCPFHQERTPSFTVYPTTQSFYCYGCGVGGNAINFAMKMGGIGFYDALVELNGGPVTEKRDRQPQRNVIINPWREKVGQLQALIDAIAEELRGTLMRERTLAKRGKIDVHTYLSRQAWLLEALEAWDPLAIAWNYCSKRSRSELAAVPEALALLRRCGEDVKDYVEQGYSLGVIGEAEHRRWSRLTHSVCENLNAWEGSR